MFNGAERALRAAARRPPDGFHAVPCRVEQTHLGGGARWDARRGELLRVDALRGRVYRDRVDEHGDLHPARVYEVAGTVSAVLPVEGDDGWLVAVGRRLAHLAVDGSLRPVAQVPAGSLITVAASDPRGRVWTGTVAADHRRRGGALHRLGSDGWTEMVLDGLTTPAAMAWSVDGETMYLVDRARGVVLAFAFDGDSARLLAGRILITVADPLGTPSGLAVDTADDLWVAMCGSGTVNRYSPDGRRRETFVVPAEQVTSCAFSGGSGHLFVTTATEGWTDERRRTEPGAGAVYRIDTRASGAPAAPCIPDPAWWAAATRRRA
jgi:sugar lactone lactonase YvrE